jgi:hypothetical protein
LPVEIGKPLISPKMAVEVLNRALAADPEAVRLLFSYRVGCNQELADDPTIQVSSYQPKGTLTVSSLGLLNGIFGVREDKYGYLTAEYEVVCPVHGAERPEFTKVGEPCPIDGCGETLGLGKLVKFMETS